MPNPTFAANSSIRPLASMISGDPALGNLRIGRSKAANVLQRQVQIALAGEGRPSERTFIPQTTAAVELLSGPHGARAEQLLRGSLAALDGRKAVGLRGISLAVDDVGYQLNAAMSHLESRDMPDLRAVGPKTRRASVEAMTDEYNGYSDYTFGVYHPDSWVNLGPSVSKQLLGAVADGRTARSDATQQAQYVLAHELEHASTTTTTKPERFGPYSWIEEGSAEVMSLQTRAARERTRAAGLPSNDDAVAENREEWLSAYSPYYHGLVSLLRLGGVDPSTRTGYETTTEILQGGRLLERVPGKLARQIIAHNNLGEKDYEPIRRMIRDSRADEERIADVGRYVADQRSTA